MVVAWNWLVMRGKEGEEKNERVSMKKRKKKNADVVRDAAVKKAVRSRRSSGHPGNNPSLAHLHTFCATYDGDAVGATGRARQGQGASNALVPKVEGRFAVKSAEVVLVLGAKKLPGWR